MPRQLTLVSSHGFPKPRIPVPQAARGRSPSTASCLQHTPSPALFPPPPARTHKLVDSPAHPGVGNYPRSCPVPWSAPVPGRRARNRFPQVFRTAGCSTPSVPLTPCVDRQGPARCADLGMDVGVGATMPHIPRRAINPAAGITGGQGPGPARTERGQGHGRAEAEPGPGRGSGVGRASSGQGVATATSGSSGQPPSETTTRFE
jgi:hypothetical protein